jgi:hypothetical protein
MGARACVLAAALLGAAALAPAAVVEIGTACFALREGEPFFVISQHSIYDQPVTEEFVVDGKGRVVLTAVSSPSAAVREYFGITAPGERHAMERAMEQVVFRVAAGEPQQLEVRGRSRSFLELGDHGDRLVMRARRGSCLVP